MSKPIEQLPHPINTIKNSPIIFASLNPRHRIVGPLELTLNPHLVGDKTDAMMMAVLQAPYSKTSRAALCLQVYGENDISNDCLLDKLLITATERFAEIGIYLKSNLTDIQTFLDPKRRLTTVNMPRTSYIASSKNISHHNKLYLPILKQRMSDLKINSLSLAAATGFPYSELVTTLAGRRALLDQKLAQICGGLGMGIDELKALYHQSQSELD